MQEQECQHSLLHNFNSESLLDKAMTFVCRKLPNTSGTLLKANNKRTRRKSGINQTASRVITKTIMIIENNSA